MKNNTIILDPNKCQTMVCIIDPFLILNNNPHQCDHKPSIKRKGKLYCTTCDPTRLGARKGDIK